MIPSCDVCGSAENLRTDHDHATGELRGLLCASCNRRIPDFETLDLEKWKPRGWREKAFKAYLSKPRIKPVFSSPVASTRGERR